MAVWGMYEYSMSLQEKENYICSQKIYIPNLRNLSSQNMSLWQ